MTSSEDRAEQAEQVEVGNYQQMITRSHLEAVRDALRLDMFRYVGNARRSIVADVAAHRYLVDRLRPTAWIPAAGGWVISYEALAGMVDHLLAGQAPARIVETGSGVSTIWLGLALREIGSGHLTSLEHDDLYAERTRSQIVRHGLERWCSVISAPLVQQGEQGGQWPAGWYDLSEWEPHPIDVLLVDGPPGANGPLARDPAFRLLGPYLSAGALVVVDDVDRSDESAMVDAWIADTSYGDLEFVADHGVSRFLSFQPHGDLAAP